MSRFHLPQVMGVINMSPNSFYKPCQNLAAGLAQAHKMVAEGAAILDIGGEATNPFVDIEAESPNVNEEIERIVPLVKKIKQEYPQVLVSVDTSSAQVMRAALDAGADIINDQRALARRGAIEVVVEYAVPVVLMHMPYERKPQSSTKAELLAEVVRYLKEKAETTIACGVKPEHIILDPGFGQGHYGKDTPENFYLLQHLDEIAALGYPVLSGWSRKSMIGEVTQADKDNRLYGTIAATTLSLVKGASIIRAHDVEAAVHALAIFQAYNKEL